MRQHQNTLPCCDTRKKGRTNRLPTILALLFFSLLVGGTHLSVANPSGLEVYAGPDGVAYAPSPYDAVLSTTPGMMPQPASTFKQRRDILLEHVTSLHGDSLYSAKFMYWIAQAFFKDGQVEAGRAKTSEALANMNGGSFRAWAMIDGRSRVRE